ncbi:Cytochrome P450 302a1, mitochondrial [Cryptotermes secundus]|uniref:Cytochrome P450 302a1, mitochondrial n=1 Tax=Cryptotermes secundus TaxID=105785 RepID=A0A2J7QSI5_9NEOP|nr:Cytochrome P450 302a1, mitochondrial [Cryptotermes secundus]
MFVSCAGKYSFKQLHHGGHKKLQEFGSIVREDIVPGVSVVWVFTPSDIEQVFRNEGRYPERRSHLALQKYRNDHPNIYNSGGLLPTNGPEWWRLRSEFQQGLSRPQSVRLYLPQTDKIIQEFIDHLKIWTKSAGKYHDFSDELSRLLLELICLVTFDVRLGSLSDLERKKGSLSSMLLEAALSTNSAILLTDNGPQLWRWVETRLYRKLKKSQKYIEQIAIDFISKRKESLKQSTTTKNEVKSLLELYLSSTELDMKDVTGMAVDMLLAGVDTTNYTTSFALYHLATNPEVQNNLYEESCRLLIEPNSPVTTDILSQAQYMKAVLKESLRLNPISVGIGRILAQDAVLSGYHVPRGTVVVTQNQVSCRLAEYFNDPNKFQPERWIKTHPLYKQVSPYLVLPFGHGPRTCIARWLAEQNMHAIILKIIRHYEVGWAGGVLDCKSLLINKPDGPLCFTFKERSKVH